MFSLSKLLPFVRRKLIAFKVALKGERRLRGEFIYGTFARAERGL